MSQKIEKPVLQGQRIKTRKRGKFKKKKKKKWEKFCFNVNVIESFSVYDILISHNPFPVFQTKIFF